MEYKLMTHLIAGFPDFDKSFEAARALIDGGSAYLEIQFPFSDGTADGSLIQSACTHSLENGFTVKKGFELLQKIRALTNIPIFVMTYANIPFKRGIKSFLTTVKDFGGSGVIIPDLPPDTDESLYQLSKSMNLSAIAVAAPSISDTRLQMIFDKKQEYIYAALRKGITGETTSLGEENLLFVRRTKSTGMKVLAGFGITSFEQVKVLMPHVEAVVVGSEFIRVINKSVENGNTIYDAMLSGIGKLTGRA